MQDFESINEILKIAIEREIEARKLYERLAGQAKDPQMKDKFKELAQQELSHKANLEFELVKQGKTVPAKITLKNSECLKPLAYDNFNDTLDIMFYAIHKEQVSVGFYTELASLTSDKDLSACLLSLAREEARHELIVEIEYERMKTP